MRFALIWFALIWFYVIWFVLMWFDFMWFDLISCYLIWFDFMWFDLILCYLILCDLILCDFIWFYVILFDLIWFDLIWFDLIWFYVIWFYVIWFVLMWFDFMCSSYHLSYNMVLNMLRVEDADPENLLKQSFYQYQVWTTVLSYIILFYLMSAHLILSHCRPYLFDITVFFHLSFFTCFFIKKWNNLFHVFHFF